MGSRNRNKRGQGFFGDNFWQSDNFNQRAYFKNLDMLLAMAMNRFRWVGLPDTCDARFLESQLHRLGIATICHRPETPDIWETLIASPDDSYNKYGIPTRWRATGWNPNDSGYEVTPENGEIVYYSWSRLHIWSALELYARKLAHYERTEDINLTHQHKPWVFVVQDKAQKLQAENVMMQTMGGEPAIIVNAPGMQIIEGIQAINTQVPYIGEELAQGYQNVLQNALLWLGIPHLAFEKGERMIEDEARANTAPTNIALLNCLNARRDACKRLRELDPARFGDLYVYFNDDWESYNFNYANNVEAQAQDGIVQDGGAEDGEL